MIELFFAAGIPFAAFLIFENIPSLEEYSYIVYWLEYSYIVYWLFIACLIAFGITVLIKAVFTIVNAVSAKKKG